MAAVVGIVSRHGLTTMYIIETSQIRISYVAEYKPLISLGLSFKTVVHK